jgi:hypothetical protein
VKTMYTSLKLGKKLRKLTETPTVLGAAVTATLRGVGEKGLLELIVAYANWNGKEDTSFLAELLLQALGEIHIHGEPTEKQNEIIDRTSKELQKSHCQFRAAVTWLCSPKDLRAVASPSLKQLESGRVEWGRYPLIDKTSEDFIRYFENHGLNHFKSRLSLQEGRLLLVPRLVHLVDLFCACILDSCLGRKSSEMPIKICLRCHKFFASQRRGFCSKDCQWKQYWTPERRSDDKWVKDLEKFSEHCKRQYGSSILDLQKRLAMPKTIQRLESIRKKVAKRDWKGWARIAQRIEAIEDVAAKSEHRN